MAELTNAPEQAADVAVIGTGIIGIATAYYLATRHRVRDIVLIDAGPPMAFTSAQSGENYRNWWPHPAMVAIANRSIDLMEAIAHDTDNRIALTRRGYALATRERDIDRHIEELRRGLVESAPHALRFHDQPAAAAYQPAGGAAWSDAPDGVDVLRHRDAIARTFPSIADDIATVIHVRRGGDLSGQQLGQVMLERLAAVGARRVTGTVQSIASGAGFELRLRGDAGARTLRAARIVTAGGPFAGEISAMLGVELPLSNVFQQKLAFEDVRGAVPRDMAFAIDLDPQWINWTDDERSALEEDAATAWIAGQMPGAIHCRPDGQGRWLKVGWAFNHDRRPASREPPLVDSFPEIVLRGATRLQPGLAPYCTALPRQRHHYGGWYTMTEENWPLIGPLGVDGAFVNGAMSGFGTMAACGAGELCAAWVAGAALPDYAALFSLARYENAPLMAALHQANKGLL